MRRIRLVLGALAVVVASFVAFAGPAVAQDLDCRDARGDLVRCDGDLYAPYDNDHYYDDYDYDDYYDNFYYNPLLFYYNNPYFYYADEDEFEDFIDEYEDFYEDVYDDYGYYYWGY